MYELDLIDCISSRSIAKEMILFDDDKPHCLFFTDCAGFLRASVRALKQPHVVYHCISAAFQGEKVCWSSSHSGNLIFPFGCLFFFFLQHQENDHARRWLQIKLTCMNYSGSWWGIVRSQSSVSCNFQLNKNLCKIRRERLSALRT